MDSLSDDQNGSGVKISQLVRNTQPDWLNAPSCSPTRHLDQMVNDKKLLKNNQVKCAHELGEGTLSLLFNEYNQGWQTRNQSN